jgi:hypothetical protein
MPGWRERIDRWVMIAGGIVAHVGLVAQAGGFVLAFLLDDPIAGYLWLVRGFWIAGLGGAGLVYGGVVEALEPGAPAQPRWAAAVFAAVGTPLWGVLCLPLGMMLLGILIVGGATRGGVRLVQMIRRRA